MIKELFSSNKDSSGKNIDRVIKHLAAQNKTSVYAWSYIKEQSFYENTKNGRRIYAYELPKIAA
ncbi:MAG: hypothetical protein V7782_01490 [Psychromonas sp.]